jgi:hypothetical protein
MLNLLVLSCTTGSALACYFTCMFTDPGRCADVAGGGPALLGCGNHEQTALFSSNSAWRFLWVVEFGGSGAAVVNAHMQITQLTSTLQQR